MLTQNRVPVSLSLLSTDLPLLTSIETEAVIQQNSPEQFHILLNASNIPCSVVENSTPQSLNRQLLWLELSPTRAIMTVQGIGCFSYRHFWEKGVYGKSQYWLNDAGHPKFLLRNYTREFQLIRKELPQYFRLEYELWTGKLKMGHYALHLEIYH